MEIVARTPFPECILCQVFSRRFWRIVSHKFQPSHFRLDRLHGNDTVSSCVYQLQPDFVLRQWALFLFGFGIPNSPVNLSDFSGSPQPYYLTVDIPIITDYSSLRFRHSAEEYCPQCSAHLNDLENILPFLVLGLLFVGTNPSLSWARTLFRVFTTGRFLHTFVYAVFVIPQPGNVCQIKLKVLI